MSYSSFTIKNLLDRIHLQKKVISELTPKMEFLRKGETEKLNENIRELQEMLADPYKLREWLPTLDNPEFLIMLKQAVKDYAKAKAGTPAYNLLCVFEKEAILREVPASYFLPEDSGWHCEASGLRTNSWGPITEDDLKELPKGEGVKDDIPPPLDLLPEPKAVAEDEARELAAAALRQAQQAEAQAKASNMLPKGERKGARRKTRRRRRKTKSRRRR